MNKKLNPIDVEGTLRSEIKALAITEVDCPVNEIGHAPGSRDICFAGNVDDETFIGEFNERMTSYLSKTAYWRRDFGIWHTQFDFNNSKETLVIQVMAKGDAEGLQKNPNMKDFDMLYVFSIFTHN